jgi:hypothetical protein
VRNTKAPQAAILGAFADVPAWRLEKGSRTMSKIYDVPSLGKSDVLLRETLTEALTFFRRENRRREREAFEDQLAVIRNRRWGYPIPRRGRRC